MPLFNDKNIPAPARILMFSQRNIYEKFHYRCSLYEFEDLICEMDSVDLIAPGTNKWFKYGTRIAQHLAAYNSITINPGITKIKTIKKYDSFIAVCQYPKDLLHIEKALNWKSQCGHSVCWLNEVWPSYLKNCREYLKILSKFDYVIVNSAHIVDDINKIIGNKCHYSPSGIDAILFSPFPNPPERSIDVYSIGRRSKETHHELLRMMNKKKIFYIYDSIDGNKVLDIHQHRLLFANICKRSRYFIVNPGKIDIPEETKNRSDFGSRYFEGAASGAILIGEEPKNEEFREYFYWTDAVVRLPFGSVEIDSIITYLDKQPSRQNIIRKNNMVECLAKHDWAYRWEKILSVVGLDPMPGFYKRKEKLNNIIKIINSEGI